MKKEGVGGFFNGFWVSSSYVQQKIDLNELKSTWELNSIDVLKCCSKYSRHNKIYIINAVSKQQQQQKSRWLGIRTKIKITTTKYLTK